MDNEPGQDRAEYAHILTDLHGITRELAALRAQQDTMQAQLSEMMADMLNPIYGQLSGLCLAVDELLPAARRAAAMFDTPVTSFLAARQEARANGGDTRAGTRTSRGRRPRAARRQLPDA